MTLVACERGLQTVYAYLEVPSLRCSACRCALAISDKRMEVSQDGPPVRPDPDLTTAELPFRFTQNARTDVNSG